ncbi:MULTISPECIES: hypothetical protein [unclassified Acinetobacter]|uniref:hypothetical protein n=1 Tax=unclassified Acinetobacter TaxID=196816 RepID=UPI001F4AD004|nr:MULTISPECIES: hypothetical protein [unclassified Acinetobacter]MCH7353310.1 hypothetical protein [Acinetobacter sp. NIPH 2023]MCH7360692.1 hypothetical protein [Acinetobacter sp. NIPH 2024]
MKNYKIKVNDEAESKEAQELFFELGYKFEFCADIQSCRQSEAFGFPYFVQATEFGQILFAIGNLHKAQELTLPQLRDLVVLHRNDVKDANYLYGQNLVLKLETQDYKIWATSKLEWVDYIGSQTDLRNSITPIQLRPKAEQGLISGADVPALLKKSEKIQFRAISNGSFKGGEWKDLSQEDHEEEFSLGDLMNSRFEWRLKPRTIKLELEIPAPKINPECADKDSYIHLNGNTYAWGVEEFKVVKALLSKAFEGAEQ